MSIEIYIHDGPLPETPPVEGWQPATDEPGARLSFVGMVRPEDEEGATAIRGITYEIYEPMATFELQRLAYEAKCKYQLYMVKIWQSRGFVPLGKLSLKMEVTAPHHTQAMRAMNELIPAIQTDVPIWKTPVAVTVVAAHDP